MPAGLAWHSQQVDLAGRAGRGRPTPARCTATRAWSSAACRPPTSIRAPPRVCTAGGVRRGRGVAIVLEPMSHFRTHLVNTPEQMHAPDRRWRVTPTCTSSSTPTTWSPKSATTARPSARSATRLWGLHACENDRGVPGGGLVPWERSSRRCTRSASTATCSSKTYNSSLGDFAYPRGMFHDVCPDGAAFARQGLAFIRGGLD